MSDEAENIDAVYDIGVVCEIKQIVRIPSSDCLRVIVEGKYRAELLAFFGCESISYGCCQTN